MALDATVCIILNIWNSKDIVYDVFLMVAQTGIKDVRVYSLTIIELAIILTALALHIH